MAPARPPGWGPPGKRSGWDAGRPTPRVPPCPPRSAPRGSRPRHPAHPQPSRRPSCQVIINHRSTRKAVGRSDRRGSARRGRARRDPAGRRGWGDGPGAGVRPGRSRGGQGLRPAARRGWGLRGAGRTASQTPPPPAPGCCGLRPPSPSNSGQTELLRTWRPQPGPAAPAGGTPLTRQHGRGRLPDDKTALPAG